MQVVYGLDDPVMIAMAYGECSYPMQVLAFRRANGQLSQESVNDESGIAGGPVKYDFRREDNHFANSSNTILHRYTLRIQSKHD